MLHAPSGSLMTLNTWDRTFETAAYMRTFFKSVSAEEFSDMLESTRTLGQQWLVERLYEKQVIRYIVRKIVGRIDRAYLGEDRLDDYIQDAVLVLMQIAVQERFDLTKSAGEIACYICLWVEQRIKRVVRKDQRWLSSLSATGDDVVERLGQDANVEEPYVFDRHHGYGGRENIAPAADDAGQDQGRTGAPGHAGGQGRRNRAAAYIMQRHDDYISSLFCSRRPSVRRNG